MGLPATFPISLESVLDKRIDHGDEAARATYRQFLANAEPKRLDHAKSTFLDAARELAGDVSLGVVSIRSCVDIEALGLVLNQDSRPLRRHIEGLEIRRGGETAITESLTLARSMLSSGGGRIVLITDGQETCGRDPCEMHGDAGGDDIVIDVVDITGVAPVACLAERTGGRIFRPNKGLDVSRLIEFVRRRLQSACGAP